MKKSVNYLQFFFIALIIIYILFGYSYIRYYYFLPTLYLYPNNNKEIIEVEKFVNDFKYNPSMEDLFKLTDQSVVNIFVKYVDMDKNELFKIEQEITIFILALKYLFNRARPKQINKNLKVYQSNSANTPAFPSGHSMQAFYLANKLSKKYPEKKTILYEIAEKCGYARIYAGLHFPSDHEFSKFLINTFF